MSKTSPEPSKLPVLLTGSFPPTVCGIGDYSARLMHELRQLGRPITVWTRQQDNLPPDAVGVAPRWDTDGFRLLFERLRRERPAFVHLQFERGIWDDHPGIYRLPFITRRLGIPLVTTFHSLDGARTWGRFHRLALLPLLLGSDSITVCSHRQQTALLRLPFVRSRVHISPVGSAIQPVTTVPRDHPSINHNSIRFVYFGFVWRGRNLELLVEVLKACRERSIHATLEVVGAVRDTDYVAELMQRAKVFGVADRVCLRGALPPESVSESLHWADVALLPFPTGVSTGRTTLMAALEHGLPIVTIGANHNSPLFRHGENMMIAPPNNPASFVALALSVAADNTLRRRLSLGAVELAKEFAWGRVAEQIASLPPYAAGRSQDS